MNALFSQMALSPANIKAMSSLSSLQSDLSELRRADGPDEVGAVKTVARQFEGMFVKMMLDAMRATTMGDPLFGGNASLLYRDMLDQQIADKISLGEGIGLADILSRQIQRAVESSGASAEDRSSTTDTVQSIINTPSRTLHKPQPVPDDAQDHRSTLSLIDTIKAVAASVEPRAADERAVSAVMPAVTVEPALETPFETPEAFVNSLWPYAVRAGESLGVSPKILIAQAALETGWGKKVLQHRDGRSSHNLFGIKADARWSGERIAATTLEFNGGAMQKQTAFFRSYPDFGQGFADYVKFVADDPRYTAATARAADPVGYIRALHRAGYATDPAYADKVLNVLNRPLVADLDKGTVL